MALKFLWSIDPVRKMFELIKGPFTQAFLTGFDPDRIWILAFTCESTYDSTQITTIHLTRWNEFTMEVDYALIDHVSSLYQGGKLQVFARWRGLKVRPRCCCTFGQMRRYKINWMA